MMMNLRNLLAVLAFVMLAACGQEAPEPAAEEAPAEVEVTDTAEPSAAAEPAEEAEAEVEVVLESAAETVDDSEAEIVLAQADTAAPAASYRFREGQHFIRLVPAQPTVGGADKIEVAEFFWYGCPHCYDFEPTINRWAAEAPANVRFVRVPAMWNQALTTHAKLFYTQEVLVRNGVIDNGEAFHAAVFDAFHNRGNRLLTEDAIRAFFGRFGVDAEEFDRTWNSFEVAQKMRVAQDLARRYGIQSVPAMVVNGKYRTGSTEAGGTFRDLINVVNELIAREGAG